MMPPKYHLLFLSEDLAILNLVEQGFPRSHAEGLVHALKSVPFTFQEALPTIR